MESRLELLARVCGPVSRETFEDLERFETALLRWNRVTNLIAPSTVSEIWQRHVVDSAQLLPLGRGADRWLDLGSGGGFPAIVLAILMKSRSDAVVHMVESNRKKASFLQTMVGDLGLPAHVHAVRIDSASSLVPETQIVTARALASLGELFQLAEPWISRGARGLFHKGRDFHREVEECSAQWESDLLEHQSVAGGEGVILEVASLRRRQAP